MKLQQSSVVSSPTFFLFLAAGHRGETLLIWMFNYDNSSAVLATGLLLCLDSGDMSSKIRIVINLVVVVVLSQHFKAPHYSFHPLNRFWLRS